MFFSPKPLPFPLSDLGSLHTSRYSSWPSLSLTLGRKEVLGDKDGGQGGKYEGGLGTGCYYGEGREPWEQIAPQGCPVPPPPCNGMDCTVRAYIKERDACTGN